VADGMIRGMLGGEDERVEPEAPEALAEAEAFAAAIAAKLFGNDPEVARDTSAFLKKQALLLETQQRHLEDEHALRVANLSHQSHLLRGQRFAQALRIGFQVFIVLVATVVGAGVAIAIRDAVDSRSVVIDPFDIAPSIAGQVPSGKIVAAGLLDVLTRIQAATRTSAERRALSNAWTNEIAINVPETGISIGQLEQALKTRFGHDQHIEGDLVKTKAGGLALTVRGTRILPKTFTSDAGDLDKLLTEAGEYVYGQSQPGLWTAFLSNNNRDDDAIRFAAASYTTVDATERPYVLNYWANAITDKGGDGAMRESLSFYREAIRLKPDYWDGYNNVMNALEYLGDEEGLVQVGKQMLKVAGGRPGRAPEEDFQNWDQMVYDLLPLRASVIADMESHGGIGANTAANGPENLTAAQFDVLLHDPEAAELRLKTTPVDDNNSPDVAASSFVRARLAEERGDLRAAASAWDSYATAYASPTVSTNSPIGICYAALTYEETRQPAKADAALNAVGALTFVDCYRFRGDLLDLRGDWTGAQEWYAKAVKLGPSIPSGYYSWGVALTKHGDLDGAVAKLEDANKKGPHWADPLKAWGDVLAKQGKPRDALAKYDEALKYAPNWQQLKAAREATTTQQR